MNTIVAQHYDNLAEDYESRWPAYNEAQINWVMDHWPQEFRKATQSLQILDVGCGTGLMLERIAQTYPKSKLTGIDISKEMLDKARHKVSSAHLMNGNIEDKNTAQKLPQADITISLSILHHLENAEIYLKLLKEKTNHKGTIFLSAFARDGLAMNARDMFFRHTQDFHTRAYSSDELMRKLKANFKTAIITSDILHPGRFWKIQIYRIDL